MPATIFEEDDPGVYEQVNFRVSQLMKARWKAYAASLDTDISDIIREAMERADRDIAARAKAVQAARENPLHDVSVDKAQTALRHVVRLITAKRPVVLDFDKWLSPTAYAAYVVLKSIWGDAEQDATAGKRLVEYLKAETDGKARGAKK